MLKRKGKFSQEKKRFAKFKSRIRISFRPPRKSNQRIIKRSSLKITKRKVSARSVI